MRVTLMLLSTTAVLVVAFALLVYWWLVPLLNEGILHDAAMRGDVDGVKKALASGYEIDDVSQGGLRFPDVQAGQTALYLASSRGHHDVARFLLEEGADPNFVVWTASENPQATTALFAAAKRSDTLMMRTLLAHGAAANAPVAQVRKDPMTASVKNGCTYCISLLLAARYQFDPSDFRTMRAFSMAAMAEDPEILRLLVPKVVSAYQNRLASQTGIPMATFPPTKVDEFTKSLVNRGYEEYLKDRAASGDMDSVVLLLLSQVDESATTPLHVAARTSELESLKSFMDLRPNLEVRSQFGSTPLMLAALMYDPIKTAELIHAGADVHQTDN